MHFTIALQLLIFCIGGADFLPSSISSQPERITFRWTTASDVSNTSCARAVVWENAAELVKKYGLALNFNRKDQLSRV